MSGSPLSTLSADERAVLSEFLTDTLDDDWWTQRETISFLLYLLDEKPAVEFTVLTGASLDDSAAIITDDVPPEDLCQGFLALAAKLDVPHHRRSVPLNGGFTAVYYECVSDMDAPLPSAQADGDTDEFHREWGEHYGYPQTAIDAFISDDCLRIYTSQQDARELCQLAASHSIPWAAVRRLALTSFIPPATEAGFREAIKRGQRYEAALRQAATDYECSAITRLVDTVLSEFDEQFAIDSPDS